MAELAQRVIKQMSRAEKRKVKTGDVTVAVWVAERVLACKPAQAERVAEEIANQLQRIVVL
jgi:hypothetical protein